jgi:regulatory protein
VSESEPSRVFARGEDPRVSAAAGALPRGDGAKRAKLTALRMLAARRLTEAQLWSKLQRKGFPDDTVRAAVEACKQAGFLDDGLFAQLYVHGKSKPLGDARLVAELVGRGIDREIAERAVEASEAPQVERARAAFEKLLRAKPSLSYPSAARALERSGFPAALIYRILRQHAADYGPLHGVMKVEAATNAKDHVHAAEGAFIRTCE